MDAFYRSRFKDNLFVIKAGGRLISDRKARENILRDIKEITGNGTNVLLIYGGGAATDDALKSRGIEIKKHNGRRITDEATLNAMRDVLGGQLSLPLLETMSQINLEGVSLNAVPAPWMDVSLRPPQDGVDFGLVGDIHDVFPRPVMRLFKSTNFIACACLALTNEGRLCNINADTIATELAGGSEAHKLIFLSDVDGVEKDGKVLSAITDKDIEDLIKDGTATGGMRVKLENCLRALDSGVRRIHLINGFRENALVKEVYEPVSPGTMILRENDREHYMNEVKLERKS